MIDFNGILIDGIEVDEEYIEDVLNPRICSNTLMYALEDKEIK